MATSMESDAPEGATQEPYAEDGYTGVKYTVDNVPIETLSDPDMTSNASETSSCSPARWT